MAESGKDLLILAHSASWTDRFEISSLVASALASGGSVDLALFFEALRFWVEGRWSELPEASSAAAPQAAAVMPPLDELMLQSHESGEGLRVFACSASVRLLGLEPDRVERTVDAIVGWPTFWRLMGSAGRVLRV